MEIRKSSCALHIHAAYIANGFKLNSGMKYMQYFASLAKVWPASQNVEI